MTILLRMDDKMNRQLTCAVSRRDSAPALAHELVQLGFIHEVITTPSPRPPSLPSSLTTVLRLAGGPRQAVSADRGVSAR
ncbi:Nuclear receptor-binding protein-like [Papilio xuthus]|uniref:Nuclear receptor-binding protein-like n=1 Tax=Papilio xuthus TaxID=66420 RepID=A0A194QJ56_PAPXU|nr:Nuclear receptor-binding protein-like [Papilio xuthus]